MPRGDRTGPAGAGPMSGRGVGFCAGNDAPGFAGPGWGPAGGGRAGGWGGGGGGWRHRCWVRATGVPGWPRTWFGGPAATSEQDLDALKSQAGFFEQALNELRRRIGEIESAGGGGKRRRQPANE